MNVFKNAKWIWADGLSGADTYAEFYKDFVWQGQKTVLRISADSDYTLWINGKFVSCNQYGGYEWYKAYDELDITPYLQAGKNGIAVLVWYFGANSQRYMVAPCGLIFEVEEGGQVCVESDESVLSRKSLAYQNGLQKRISGQLGFSFAYDANPEDNWKNGELCGFGRSVVVQEKNCSLIPRPIEKSDLLPVVTGKVLQNENDKSFLLDLGEEKVGLLSLSFTSSKRQKIVVAYGEHLLRNGDVLRKIGSADFSVEYVAKPGENVYVNYMLRLACRYLRIECEEEITLSYAGIIPQVYPVKVKPFETENELDRAIYGICLNSLRLCMMEHYVDCPWREQCFYAFDSRNQMLCGYEAFEGGNYAYARANLLLAGNDRYPSGLMAICYPCGSGLTIPSFSLYYTLSVKEYIEETGDYTLAKEVYARIKRFLDVFLANRKNGLVYRFEGKENWNFYDWSEGSDGTLGKEDAVIADAQINILTVMGLRSFERICALAGLEYPYANVADELSKATYDAFFDKETGFMRATLTGEGGYLEIVNALAVNFGVVTGAEAERICEALARKELVTASLSMKCFIYDALLLVNEDKYRAFVLDDIRKNYKPMVEFGSTATWETAGGAEDFGFFGSLCHGWTATPIYYFRKLL